MASSESLRLIPDFRRLHFHVVGVCNVRMSQVSLRLPNVVHKVDRIQAIKNGVVVLKVVDRMVVDFGLVATHLPAGLIGIFHTHRVKAVPLNLSIPARSRDQNSNLA